MLSYLSSNGIGTHFLSTFFSTMLNAAAYFKRNNQIKSKGQVILITVPLNARYFSQDGHFTSFIEMISKLSLISQINHGSTQALRSSLLFLLYSVPMALFSIPTSPYNCSRIPRAYLSEKGQSSHHNETKQDAMGPFWKRPPPSNMSFRVSCL